MNEKPIIFSGEMVRAILDGRKTQTRRALKVQPIDILPMKVPNMWVTLRIQDKQNPENTRGDVIRCRFGIPGDRLWVRETWMPVDLSFREPAKFILKTDKTGKQRAIIYKADTDYFCQWKQSIFMPRWASRITLEIVNIKVEPLWAINRADAFAEGVRSTYSHQPPDWLDIDAFRELWDKLNKKRGYGWDVNPWVWVIEFKKVKQ